MKILLGCMFFIIASVAIVVGMGFVGMGALQRMEEVSEKAALQGITPADAGPPILRQLWSTDLELSIQTLVALPNDEILMIRASGGSYRVNASGELVTEADWPDKAHLADADPRGVFDGILMSSSITKWRWSFQGYETLRRDLFAWDTSGVERWRFSQDPDDAGRIDPFFGDFDGDGATEIACPLKRSIVVLNLQGEEINRFEHRAVSQRFAVADLDQDGADEMIWDDLSGPCKVLKARTGEVRELDLGADIREIETTTGYGPPTIMVLRRVGPSRDAVEAFNADAEPLFSDEFESHIRGIARPSVFRADFDGDGSEAWVVAEGDGAIRLYSHDGTRRGVHYTGVRIKDLIRVRRNGGDVLVAATHRGAAAWGRPDDRSQIID